MSRKKIVIGETYLFDVMNHTNLAPLHTLVTVVEKKGFEYVVLSVNNGDVFKTPAKYLTPYVKGETVSVIRCHYGTTELNEKDADYFDMIDSVLDVFIDMVPHVIEPEHASLMVGDLMMMKTITKGLKDKIQQYVNISKYQDMLKTLFTLKKNNIKGETDHPKNGNKETIVYKNNTEQLDNKNSGQFMDEDDFETNL